MNHIELRQAVMNLTDLKVPHANKLLMQVLTNEDRIMLGELLEQNQTTEALELIKSKEIDSRFLPPHFISLLNTKINSLPK